MRDVKAAGGMTVVQKPESAEYDGMPRAAINTGAVDFVLPIEEMADVIIPYAQHPYVQAKPHATLADTAPDHFRAILSLLWAHSDHDFSRYKTGTLTRRIDRRMGIRHISQPGEYLKLLREDSNELRSLFKDLLIGVTRFFRDPEAWDELANQVARTILDKRDEEPFRVWIPGCATGEEAYTAAILLFEQQQRHHKRLDIQVFGTDIDADAIEFARLGVYPENVAKDLKDSRIDTFFQREGEKLRVRKKLRETCIFAAQNLLSDPPFSNLDLICCRNLLIYLESDVQGRVFDMLHFALNPKGLLFLGSSESPGHRKHLFDVLSQPSRIYCKVGESKPGSGGFPIDRPKARTTGQEPEGQAQLSTATNVGTVELSKRALLDEFAPASVVVNERGLIQYIHGPVSDYLGFPSGEPELDVAAMAREGLKAKIRTALQQARSRGETVSVVAPRVQRNGSYVRVRVRVHPLAASRRSQPLFLMSFLDESPPVPASDSAAGDASGHDDAAGQPTDHHLALELQATREDLQSTIEELESANEELKASNEEVMSMNEELQSTNEELETSREELQSMNEELSTVNNQLHDKVEELEAMTNDLTNLLASTDMATLFLDSHLRIRRYTPATSRLMSILETDIGRPISDLAPRVNDADLVDDAREVLDRLTPSEKEVQSGEETWFMRRILPFRTSDNKIEGVVVTFFDITRVKNASKRLEFRERQQAVIAQLGRAALAGEDLPALCDRVVRDVAEMLEVDLCKILRLEPDRKSFFLIAGVGWNNGLVGNVTIPNSLDSQAGYTLQTSGPVIVRDLGKEQRFSGPELLTEHGVVSGISILIGSEEAPWGVIGAHTREPSEFTVDDANFLQAVANVLWEAIRREQAEALLRQRERRLTLVTDAMPVLIAYCDKDMRYRFCNAQYETWFGLKRDEIIGKQLAEIIGAEAFTSVKPFVDRTLRGERVSFQQQLPYRHGPKRYVQVEYAPEMSDDGEVLGYYAMIEDTTERVQAEHAQARLAAIVEHSNDAIVGKDLHGIVTSWNAAAQQMYGYAESEMIGQPLTRICPAGRKHEIEQILAMIRQGEAVEHFETVRQRKDGALLDVSITVSPIRDHQGEVVGASAISRDVTLRKEREQALAESEERLRLAARLAGFGTYYMDVETNTVSWSPELKGILGLRPDDPVPVRAAEVPDFVHEKDRERVANKLKASLDASGEGEFRDEHRIVRPNGEVRWLLMQGRTVFRGHGANRRPVRVAGVVLDMTERREFEEALHEARRAAEAANDAKSIFLANMSHEIRTPMTAILGYADVLQARLDDPDAEACLRTIRENGQYLCDLLNDILDLSKIESGKLSVRCEACCIVRILCDIRSLMAVRATEKGLSLWFEVDGRIPATVETDPKMLRQILVNLVGNGIKFTEHGSVQVVARCLEDRELLEFSIIDTGIGISEHHRDKLFTPFEQVDNSATRAAGGSGLGLAISQRLVARLGGELTVESQLNEGSTFRFTLPTGPLVGVEWTSPDAGTMRTELLDAAPEDLPRISGRILAVDDRPEIRLLAREFVQLAGGEIRTAENGKEALEVWQRAADDQTPFDLVLMDVQMPEMDGLEATRKLRSEGYRGPIIALTANAMRKDQDDCQAAGCDDFIAKPIDRAEFLRKLSHWLDDSAVRATDAPPSSGLTILCVDDNEATRVSQKMLLAREGHQVEIAASGEETLTLLEDFIPDVVLLDLGLEGMSGGDLLSQLKLRPELSNCLFICQSGRREDEVSWREMGFDYFLQKPADFAEIRRILASRSTP